MWNLFLWNVGDVIYVEQFRVGGVEGLAPWVPLDLHALALAHTCMYVCMCMSIYIYAPSHRQNSTNHGLCYTSCGVLAGTRNSSVGPP